ncbi:MAG: FHA domain-containing protein [Caldilineales bacterium]|nr:FHA domain-containing protein [Caldilineales bacterium]
MTSAAPLTDPTLVLPPRPGFAWLVALAGPPRGRLYPLDPTGVRVGQAAENDIAIEHPALSRVHARFYAEAGGQGYRFCVQDLASAGGVYINGERVVQRELHDDDRIHLGPVPFVFKQL